MSATGLRTELQKQRSRQVLARQRLSGPGCW